MPHSVATDLSLHCLLGLSVWKLNLYVKYIHNQLRFQELLGVSQWHWIFPYFILYSTDYPFLPDNVSESTDSVDSDQINEPAHDETYNKTCATNEDLY